MHRLTTAAGAALIAIGVILLIGSVTALGTAHGWSQADAFAAESRQPVHRTGLLLGAVGLAALLAVTPALVARLHGTPGFGTAVAGWVGLALGAALFLLVLGLTTIALPALGDLASRGISPQVVVDQFIRQPAIVLAFLGGNALYLSWVVLGAAVMQSGVFPSWLGWSVMAGAAAGWLSFLHVPVLQQIGGPLWTLSVVLLGIHLLRGG